MSNANVRPYLLLMIFAIAACKPLQAADDQVRVVPASELGQWWQVVPGHDPQPPHLDMAQPLETGCIAVAFEIQGDGSVSNERVWRTTLTDSLAGKRLERGALQAMHQSRFLPAPANKNNSAVYTYYVFTFTLIS
ncbi:MAG: hypothetical protein JSS21_08090, partial [Proteobacteria bacterium]|nr:hypothetical protein [Pseudomonadota bacterium]